MFTGMEADVCYEMFIALCSEHANTFSVTCFMGLIPTVCSFQMVLILMLYLGLISCLVCCSFVVKSLL